MKYSYKFCVFVLYPLWSLGHTSTTNYEDLKVWKDNLCQCWGAGKYVLSLMCTYVLCFRQYLVLVNNHLKFIMQSHLTWIGRLDPHPSSGQSCTVGSEPHDNGPEAKIWSLDQSAKIVLMPYNASYFQKSLWPLSFGGFHTFVSKGLN